jgi:hypothetical protein
MKSFRSRKGMNEKAWQLLEGTITEQRCEAFALHRNGTWDARQTLLELIRVEAEHIQAVNVLYEKQGCDSSRRATGRLS